MEALRKIIDSEELQKVIPLPNSFRNRKLELVVLPAAEENLVVINQESAKGKLSRFKKPELIYKESEAWKKAVGDKYGNS